MRLTDTHTCTRSHTLTLTCLLVGFLLSACSTGQFEFDEDDAIDGNLYRVTNASVGLAYANPDVDFSRYTKIMLNDLDTSKTVVKQPRNTSSTVGNQPFELTAQNRESLATAYREMFEKELAETGDYEIVDAPGPDVLRIAAALTEIAPTAAKDDNRSRPTGRSRVYTEGAGAMAITFAFGDSETDTVLAIVKDSREGTPMWGLNNAVTNMRDVRIIFGRWARMVRARLDIAHGY